MRELLIITASLSLVAMQYLPLTGGTDSCKSVALGNPGSNFSTWIGASRTLCEPCYPHKALMTNLAGGISTPAPEWRVPSISRGLQWGGSLLAGDWPLEPIQLLDLCLRCLGRRSAHQCFSSGSSLAAGTQGVGY